MSTQPPARDPDPTTITQINNAAMTLNHDCEYACNPVVRNDADGGVLELTIEDTDAVPPAVLGVAADHDLSLSGGQPQGEHFVATFG